MPAHDAPQTERIVNRDLLLHAKPGLHLINIARGALIDDEALLSALNDGRVARASLDVTHPEPLPEGHPFYGHPRVRLSPHTSVHTPAFTTRWDNYWIEGILWLVRNLDIDGTHCDGLTMTSTLTLTPSPTLSPEP